MDSVRPDEFVLLSFNYGNDRREFAVNANFDRIDYFPKFGAFILKVYTEDGMRSIFVDEDNAHKIIELAELPFVERDFMYESEHENWVTVQTAMLDDEWLE